MTDELSKSIERLRSLSPKLNKTTDEANRTIQLVENFLNDECKIGIPIFVEVDSYKSTNGNGLVGYDRCGARFRIIFRHATYQRNDDGEVVKDYYDDPEISKVDDTPLADCARGIKLKALACLPELLKNLASEAEAAITSADETIAAVAQIVGAIGNVKAEAPKRTAGLTPMKMSARGSHDPSMG